MGYSLQDVIIFYKIGEKKMPPYCIREAKILHWKKRPDRIVVNLMRRQKRMFQLIKMDAPLCIVWNEVLHVCNYVKLLDDVPDNRRLLLLRAFLKNETLYGILNDFLRKLEEK